MQINIIIIKPKNIQVAINYLPYLDHIEVLFFE